ncbi:MOSC N-terminal beta barrel domain-containing protein [Brucella pituitosa]|uniref:MOSC N-terminal beta barrel domain-containing protein n=1 Tax=Brucella pituitosa TaxID=571256 RepID=UPI0013E2D320
MKEQLCEKIGRVREVWRYPVSSLGGETLASITVSPEGIAGDRRFALFDPETGLAAAPEKGNALASRPLHHRLATALRASGAALRRRRRACAR